MKKTISLLAVFCMAAAANATILRVSNVEGSSAPYTSISSAISAAADGDTIMVEGSNNTYGTLKRQDNNPIDKKVVILGPGYWLTENEKTNIGAAAAIVNDIEICAEGAEICGMYIDGRIGIYANKVIVNRCRIQWGIFIDKFLENIIIHQNAISGGIEGELYNNSNGMFPPIVTISYMQITNNIFLNDPSGSGREGIVKNLTQSVIANNTWAEFTGGMSNILDSTVKDNIIVGGLHDDRCDGTTFTNNVELEYDDVDTYSLYTDHDVMNEYTLKSHSSVGAFSGDTPYVLSGIPAGPVIEDLIVPASVEKGSKLQVTIKVGIQQ